MDELLTFAYADPATLTSASLDARLAERDGHGMFAMLTPTQNVGIDGLRALQQELRELLEATADGPTTPTVATTVHQYLTKPPGRMPPRLAGHYMLMVFGEWRDVVTHAGLPSDRDGARREARPVRDLSASLSGTQEHSNASSRTSR